MEATQITGQNRNERGTAQVKKRRGEGLVPAVLYGGALDTRPIWISDADAKGIVARRRHVVSLQAGEEAVQALVKEIQYDPLGEFVLHMDFQRLRAGERMEVRLPLVLKGQPEGVKQGGALEHHVHTLVILADPSTVPEQLVADVSGLKLDEVLKASAVVLPEGAELVTAADSVIASVYKPEEEQETQPAEELKEPEVTGKGGKSEKKEEEPEE